MSVQTKLLKIENIYSFGAKGWRKILVRPASQLQCTAQTGLKQKCLEMCSDFESLSNINLLYATGRYHDEIRKLSYIFIENKRILESGIFWREFCPRGSSRKPSRSKVRALVITLYFMLC